MRWIYLSPHFDDAVLSCGGLIWEQAHRGTPVEIWTICAGDAPPGPLSALAQRCHAEWNTQSTGEALAMRRLEDRHAARLLGAVVHHFAVPDCIYRRSPQGENLYLEGLNIPLHPAETGLDLRLAAALAQELRTEDILVCPLCIGGHVDHILTRFAAGSLGRSLLYYADVPYVITRAVVLDGKRDGLHCEHYPVSEAGLRAWQEAVAAYASQIAVLFETNDKMREAIRSYWRVNSGACLWSAS